MDFKIFNEALNKFGKYVIQQSRTRLTKAKKGKGELYNSLKYTIDQKDKDFILNFFMEDYGMFQDQGVKGFDPSKVSPNSKIKGQQAPNSPFKFGSGSKRGTFPEFVNRMTSFAKQKNLRFRDKKGRFAKGSYKSMGYVVAKNIYNRGLKPSYFFTIPFDRALIRLPEQLAKDFADDIRNEINN